MLRELSKIYKHALLPHVKDIRGATRLLFLLQDAALSREVEQVNGDGYRIDFAGISWMLSDLEDFTPLLYERPFVDQYTAAITGNTVVCDIGAFHGFYTVIGAQIGSEVYAFEIDPENMERIRQNLSLNKNEDTSVINQAMWDTSGKIQAETGRGAKNQAGRGDREIVCTTMDDFFADRSIPDVIKIDVEGAEHHVLQGADEVLEKRPMLFVEVHGGEQLAGFNHAKEDVFDLLRRYDYTLDMSPRDDETLVIAE